jgi:hypothetical protein
MAGLTKRVAKVPQEALDFAEGVSKADLLEAAWHLASRCNGGESCEDDAATMRRLHDEVATLCANRGAKPLPPLEALRQKWATWAQNRRAMIERFRK